MSGDFGEHCLSTQRELRSRPAWRATQGTPAGSGVGAVFFLGYFLLDKQKKVTARRRISGPKILRVATKGIRKKLKHPNLYSSPSVGIGPRTTSSETELIAWLRIAQARKSLGLIGIDGANGSGKSHLARQLAAALNCTLVECDLFIRNGALTYPDILDLECLASVVSAAVGRATPVIVEGVMLRLVLNKIAQPHALHIYVRHSWPVGSYTHRDLFDPGRTEQDLIAEENALCGAIGITVEEPILARELIVYHKQHCPHQCANILFEALYQPAG